ncbi:hypothetical protein B0T25DRAFT_87486 [Lasiosphaeria hispida]|uniref:Uncharacterized protein n=1 Tax=Lasiosphaeria hispida TaxID=260671 RepID=A0AAJ0MHD2_9PEZI|nr:hypothetical protein B0T25DRAFT_87486 [Lasiosphaeria hispida]
MEFVGLGFLFFAIIMSPRPSQDIPSTRNQIPQRRMTLAFYPLLLPHFIRSSTTLSNYYFSFSFFLYTFFIRQGGAGGTPTAAPEPLLIFKVSSALHHGLELVRFSSDRITPKAFFCALGKGTAVKRTMLDPDKLVGPNGVRRLGRTNVKRGKRDE